MEWQIVHNVSRGPLPLYGVAAGTVMDPTVLIYCWPLVAAVVAITVLALFDQGLVTTDPEARAAAASDAELVAEMTGALGPGAADRGRPLAGC